jgi:hypothetical protein
MLRHFEESDYLDCRISAYPRLTQYKSINLVAPSLVMIDLDLVNFDSRKKLDNALKSTLKQIYQLLKVRPTVLWTGNGYHIYLPIKAFILEEEEIFTKFQNGNSNDPSLSTEFMRFAEKHFTNNKHDPQHRPSVNSCLLRVPGSYNVKNGQQVRVIQKWDGKKAAIQHLLRNFRRYLIQDKLDEINGRNMKLDKPRITISSYAIRWIESLLQTPIPDYRKYCIWRILVPYLVNVLKLHAEETTTVVSSWLDNCNTIKKLSFNPKYLLKYNIRNVRDYYPISWNTLKIDNIYLCRYLECRMYKETKHKYRNKRT